MAVQITQYRFTVTEYDRMIESGVLAEDARVELIDGAIVDMVPIGKQHQACIDRLTDTVIHASLTNIILRVQGPLSLDSRSQVQPDVMILKRRPDFYASSLPGPADVLLLVEVADSTIGYDRTTKIPLYARLGIAEAWLIDMPKDQVELYTQPANGSYQQIRLLKRGEEFTSPAFPGRILRPEMILD